MKEIAYNEEGISLQTGLLISGVSVLSIFSFAACLYCFKFKAKDLEDEDDHKSYEKHQISRGASLDSRLTQERDGKNFWGKIPTWFSISESREASPQQLSTSSTTNTMYDKPPMGTMSASFVQPRTQIRGQSSSSSLVHQNSFTNASENGERSGLTSASIIPESFRRSLDFSIDMSEEPPSDDLGRIEFSTIYVFTECTLWVHIIKATGLPAMDLSGTSDPFVKCCLLPDRKRKLETKTKRKTLNPVWKEKLSFEGLVHEKIQQRVLYLQVLDYDRFSRNDPIGEIYLPLHTINLGEELRHNIPLEVCKGSSKRGELLLSLCYQPLEGSLDVGVLKGKNMRPMDIGGTSDPYVKIWMLHNGKKTEKKKTQVIKNTLNPNFDQHFIFGVNMKKLREIQFEITVMDYDSIGRNDTIGKIYLGHKSRGLEKQHWKDMLSHIRNPVSQWHVLKV